MSGTESTKPIKFHDELLFIQYSTIQLHHRVVPHLSSTIKLGVRDHWFLPITSIMTVASAEIVSSPVAISSTKSSSLG